MKTLTRNVTLLGVCVVAGLALLAVKSQLAAPYAPKAITGKTFTIRFVENAKDENYSKWVLVSHSANITPTTITYENADSKKAGERKAVFAFEAIEAGPATVIFHQVNARSNNILADSERTFNFAVK